MLIDKLLIRQTLHWKFIAIDRLTRSASGMRHGYSSFLTEAALQKCKHGAKLVHPLVLYSLPPQYSLKFPSWVAINNVKKVGQWNPHLFYLDNIKK